MNLLHPISLFLFLCPVFAFFSLRWAKRISLITCVLVCILWFASVPFPQFELDILNGLWKLDSLSANQKLFAKIYFLTLCVSLGFSYQSQKKRELFAIVFHALLSCSVILAKKWIDFFVYWELMSLGSFLLIWTSPHKEAKAAGIRYFIYHVLGGGLLMIGCAWAMLRNTPYGQALPMHTSSLFILLACLINVGAVPFHTWVKDAYPKTSIYASPVLSVFVTKTSVFALIVLFPGFSPLIVIGACMSIYGALYALLENNLRKLLSYHIVSQVGFMVCAVGIGSTLSLQGAVSHAVCHILYKSLLFMSVGSLIYGLGREKLSSLGSLRKLMPWTFICYIIGGLSISGVPFFNGFVSKSIIIEASKNGHTWLPWILKAASIGTFLSVGLKLPYYAFIKERAHNDHPTPLPLNMKISMSVVAFLCFVIGVFPDLLYKQFDRGVDFHPYAIHHFMQDTLLLLGVFIAFIFCKKLLQPTDDSYIDLDDIIIQPISKMLSKGLQGLSSFHRVLYTQEQSFYASAINSKAKAFEPMSFSSYVLIFIGIVCLCSLMIFFY